MPENSFDRDHMASWYAHEHLQVDPGVQKIFYLPKDAPDREIRLLEINTLLADRLDSSLEPLDFGVDVGTGEEHTLFVLDVTPRQYDLIERSKLSLPPGWSLNDTTVFEKSRP